jgi:hypothetical protein
MGKLAFGMKKQQFLSEIVGLMLILNPFCMVRCLKFSVS